MAILVNDIELRHVRENYEEVKKAIQLASANGMPLIELHIRSYRDDTPDVPVFLNYGKLVEIRPD